VKEIAGDSVAGCVERESCGESEGCNVVRLRHRMCFDAVVGPPRQACRLATPLNACRAARCGAHTTMKLTPPHRALLRGARTLSAT
jgi:hypothetical protein